MLQIAGVVGDGEEVELCGVYGVAVGVLQGYVEEGEAERKIGVIFLSTS